MGSKSGDRCPSCNGGQLGVVNSKASGQYQVRYLRCGNCAHTDKEIVPAAEIRRRKSRTSDNASIARAYRHGLGPKARFDVLKRDGFQCVYCGQKAPEVRLHVDHVVPISKGGSNDMSNLVSACELCNVGKGKRLA